MVAAVVGDPTGLSVPYHFDVAMEIGPRAVLAIGFAMFRRLHRQLVEIEDRQQPEARNRSFPAKAAN